VSVLNLLIVLYLPVFTQLNGKWIELNLFTFCRCFIVHAMDVEHVIIGIPTFSTKTILKVAACCFHHQALMMEATSTSETLVNFYQTTRRYNPEDSHLHTHLREIFNSY
jgi:hypothetical protein